MDINSIPSLHRDEVDLRHLRVLDVLLREHSLTRAAEVLNVTQPALSKTLARLRLYFADPLFVRVAMRMEPTPKALELQAPVRAILDHVRMLRNEHAPFDPATSDRIFNFCVVDAGVIKLLPPLIERLKVDAPNVRLRALQFDAAHLEAWLESGTVDFAMGSFPSLINGIKRRKLWTEQYVTVTNKGHPRLKKAPSKRDFAAEKHVLVSTAGTGHAHREAERAIEAAVPPENIICRVQLFTAAAVVAKRTGAVATLPLSIATVLAKELDLAMVKPPIKMPSLEIYQYWHERYDREPGNRWIRKVFSELFRD